MCNSWLPKTPLSLNKLFSLLKVLVARPGTSRVVSEQVPAPLPSSLFVSYGNLQMKLVILVLIVSATKTRANWQGVTPLPFMPSVHLGRHKSGACCSTHSSPFSNSSNKILSAFRVEVTF